MGNRTSGASNRAESMLALLDSHATAGDFPALDNAHWHLASGRMRGLRSRVDWALLVELLVFNEPELTYVTEAYAFGTLVTKRGFQLLELPAIEPSASSPLWTPAGEWIQASGIREIRLGDGTLLSVCCDPSGENCVRLEPGDCYDEVRFLRGVVGSVGMDRLTPRQAILNALPRLREADEIISLENWDHPDINGGERPSGSLAIRACCRYLAGETLKLDYEGLSANVHWTRWQRLRH